MITVFNPKFPIDVYYDWFENNKYFQPSVNLEEVLAQPIKIACLPVFFNIAKMRTSQQTLPDDIVDQFDLILLSDIEYFTMAEIAQWISKSKIKNYCLAVGSFKKDTSIDNVIYRPWWAFNLMNKNTFIDTNSCDKPFLFDALLGRIKLHRSLVMNRFNESTLLEKSIVTYRKSVFDMHNDRSRDYISPNLDPAWEVAENIDYAISDRVPWDIYKQTYYSVVTETLGADTFFWSEKTTKPLLSKRLFIHVGASGFLKNLQHMGFKTFNNVIDESYDLIVNNKDRWTAAFDQIEYLGKLDPVQVMSATEDIRTHNHNRLFEFRQKIKTQMLEMVYNKIKEIK